jgi:hypothetical protein
MKRELKEIRLLPPLAISRLGNSPEPVNNYDVEVDPKDPLGFRKITSANAKTVIVDTASGEVADICEGLEVTFKDKQGRVRPVAPFIELWGRFGDEDDWSHLTRDDIDIDQLHWRVRLGNVKLFRRTGDVKDRILADSEWFNDHAYHEMLGKCENFLPRKVLPLGHVQFLKPTDQFPHIRFRYTPAEGKVYGSNWFVKKADGSYQPANSADDPTDSGSYLQHDLNIADVLYNSGPDGGKWAGYTESTGSALTIPAQIYAGQSGANGWVSSGYLDDECDGVIEVELRGKQKLSAFSRIGAGPPAYAPDSFPIRTVFDELEQALLGWQINDGDYTDEELQHESEEIIRRAFETVRLMNTTVMNGNQVGPQPDIASTMVRQDRGDTERAFEPIMAETIVDNLAVRALHQNIYASLSSGAPPWFISVIRKFDEIGDLSTEGRRKMPAMMRNADGRYLTLTRRQREKIRLAANRLTSTTEKKR